MARSEVLATVLAVFAYLLIRLLRVGRREQGLPPGPPTIPVRSSLASIETVLRCSSAQVLGNLLSIPPRYAHLYFHGLVKQYGPVTSLKLFGGTMIVLNNAEGVVELLDKRSGSFNERAPAYINGAPLQYWDRMASTCG